jgi:hypothetical protein
MIFWTLRWRVCGIFFEEHCFPKWWVEQPAEDCAPETALANELFTLSVMRHDSQRMGLIPQQ